MYETSSNFNPSAEEEVVYVINNTWELFISLLLDETVKSENLYIVNKSVLDPKILERLKKIKKVIEISIDDSIIKKGILFFIRIYYIFPRLLKNINCKKIISFSDQDVVTRFFINKKCEIILYEHGIINYQKEFNEKLYRLKKLLFRMEKPYGRSESVKSIYLTRTEDAPEDIRNKVKKLDLKNIIKKSSEDKKNMIMDIFIDNSFDLKKIDLILLTQPLEIKCCSENEKIEIYKELVKKYKRKYKNIALKPHPLEKTNYKNEINGVVILSKDYPIELLLFLDQSIKKVVTLFSSSALNFLDVCDIDFLGTENYKHIIKNRIINSKKYKK